MSKIFELYILAILEPFLMTTTNQFGFEKQYSTDMCIFATESVIKY